MAMAAEADDRQLGTLRSDEEGSESSRRQSNASHADSEHSKTDSKQSAGSRARRSSVVGEFIKAEKMSSEVTVSTKTTTAHFQKWSAWLANSRRFSHFMICIIVADAACTWIDIDARAAGEAPSIGVLTFLDLSLAMYTLELLLRFLGRGAASMLSDWMAWLDMAVVICGYVEMILNAIYPTELMARLQVMRALRLVRILRLLRFFRKLRAIRELQKLVTMMATCLRTLAWSFLLCFGIMTLWAMLLVEVVYPIVQAMPDAFADCDYCDVSTRSVMSANLLLFKTVIAGDGWGRVAVPVIQQNPWTAVLFVGSLLTLVFGVLNIIIAVVVDTFAEARQNDVQNLAEEMESDLEKNKKELTQLFTRIDRDGSGQLSLEELILGARRDPILQSRLRVMDIDENDLQQLFCMIDVDNSGTIEAAEFIGPLSRWVHDSKTAPRFIKYNMLQTMQLQEDLYTLSQTYFRDLSQRMDTLSADVQCASAGWTAHDVGLPRLSSPSSFMPRQSSDESNRSTRSAKADGKGIEQPTSCVTPKMMSDPTCAEGSPRIWGQNEHRAPDRELIRLLDGVVAKVERGMIEMENRLKRALGPLGTDGLMVQSKVTERSLDRPLPRADLFRAVYGEAKNRNSSFSKLPPYGLGRSPVALHQLTTHQNLEELPVRRVKSTR